MRGCSSPGAGRRQPGAAKAPKPGKKTSCIEQTVAAKGTRRRLSPAAREDIVENMVADGLLGTLGSDGAIVVQHLRAASSGGAPGNRQRPRPSPGTAVYSENATPKDRGAAGARMQAQTVATDLRYHEGAPWGPLERALDAERCRPLPQHRRRDIQPGADAGIGHRAGAACSGGARRRRPPPGTDQAGGAATRSWPTMLWATPRRCWGHGGGGHEGRVRVYLAKKHRLPAGQKRRDRLQGLRQLTGWPLGEDRPGRGEPGRRRALGQGRLGQLPPHQALR